MDLKEAKALARKRLSDKRYHHTLNVEKMAVKLAKRYGADQDQAALAALLHDTAKEMPIAEQLALLRSHPDLAGDAENRPTPVWHGACAAILAKTKWGVEDEAVLSAVACHTAGKPGMSLLDKILFLADMTSAERDFEGVERLRRLEMEDIDRAMLEALDESVSFVKRGGKPLDPMSAAAREDIQKRLSARAEALCTPAQL